MIILSHLEKCLLMILSQKSTDQMIVIYLILLCGVGKYNLISVISEIGGMMLSHWGLC